MSSNREKMKKAVKRLKKDQKVFEDEIGSTKKKIKKLKESKGKKSKIKKSIIGLIEKGGGR